ncbi:MAG: hypothetical protein CK426_02940 [Legionella sp.]|nr:MAG: hypothetical protein CK423_07505 [Legionella sp.]PJD99407.1 MAG: hypothetical protein CK426_02940 [Legionella sp.]
MKVLWIFLFFLNMSLLWGKAIDQYPDFNLKYLAPPPATVYYGEKLAIPFVLHFIHLADSLVWYSLPAGSYVEQVFGHCPPVGGIFNLWRGDCHYNLIIPGNAINKVFSGAPTVAVLWQYDNRKQNFFHKLAPIHVQVIPHCPSMLNIPVQQATANSHFVLPLRPFVQYYEENLRAGTAFAAQLVPGAQDGLLFDAKQFAITGIPTRIGTYTFAVGGMTSRCKTQPTTITIKVVDNPKDKPVFKNTLSLLTAMPDQIYRMNLLELLETPNHFMVSNQLSFRIESKYSNAAWLSISPTNPTLLEGKVPAQLAGQMAKFTLVASSNTGGDSEPVHVSIPIAYDPSRKPAIKPFVIEHATNQLMDFDLRSYVVTMDDEPWTLFVDKIEPMASWLSHTATALQGIPPADAAGQQYDVTLRVNTESGGSSDAITVPIKIAINPQLTPYFEDPDIILPVAMSNTYYSYDFAKNNTVLPENIPYQIEFDTTSPQPGWVTIQNNRLIIKQVPETSANSIPLRLLIRNLPGGTSLVYRTDLKIISNSTL